MRALENPAPPPDQPGVPRYQPAQQRALDRVGEAERAMRALENPAPPPDQPGVPRYQPAERRDLDRLIENAR
jgi:hypothetical protein